MIPFPKKEIMTTDGNGTTSPSTAVPVPEKRRKKR
jgi:hypothetical protein